MLLCSYYEVAYLIPYQAFFKPDGPESGDVRLTYVDQGQAKVFLLGRWLPVADNHMNWTLANAEVVCRQLGYAPNSMLLCSTSSKTLFS